MLMTIVTVVVVVVVVVVVFVVVVVVYDHHYHYRCRHYSRFLAHYKLIALRCVLYRGAVCLTAIHISRRRRRGHGSRWRARQAALLEPVHGDRRTFERRDASDQQGLGLLRRAVP